MTRQCLRLATLALFAISSAPGRGQNFALHNGDRVVFYGDSITAQRLYSRFVEDFVLTRYPQLHVTFWNAGIPETPCMAVIRAICRRALRAIWFRISPR
jgi:hypothetical protein